MNLIQTPHASAPGGHYSQAVVHNGTVYISGLLPIDARGEKCLGSIEEQTRTIFENLDAILKASGSSRQQVLKTTVYIADITLWGAVNALYVEFFGTHKPARAVVPVPTLHHGFLIEIEGVAGVKV